MQTLVAYTGSLQRVYNYDRNSEFVKVLNELVMASSECADNNSQVFF